MVKNLIRVIVFELFSSRCEIQRGLVRLDVSVTSERIDIFIAITFPRIFATMILNFFLRNFSGSPSTVFTRNYNSVWLSRRIKYLEVTLKI